MFPRLGWPLVLDIELEISSVQQTPFLITTTTMEAKTGPHIPHDPSVHLRISLLSRHQHKDLYYSRLKLQRLDREMKKGCGVLRRTRRSAPCSMGPCRMVSVSSLFHLWSDDVQLER